ncbi:transcriptional regulator, AraC family [Fibrella aestuarina BUZ 2]|uniref:Transcriptional regulator, AraC family n=1 Tax=Fibrella aestuarina BUZ 2 TaxID=1166018 RepID=I0KB92_9BACT|nr:chromate resistance protein ChrB domain-containing protein [Fibrella aestuarina]CCH01395.1 transcriptional regulator, AraC family [Fibrella aestuarina BUZ 2]
MIWITRERPKIDRIACPWLIRRFIDPEAQIVFVPADEVLAQAAALGATPFDVPGVEFSHYGTDCTFDYFLKKYDLRDPALHTMAPIVRGADTDNHALAEQAAGLWAISAGLAHNLRDDEALLAQGMVIYDALYSWATYLQHEKHTQSPTENRLAQVMATYLALQKKARKRTPGWIRELETLIQEHVDTNRIGGPAGISLKAVSEAVQLNPTYLSREFATHFDNLTFGEYIRKLRIDKAIQLLDQPAYSLLDIAYLTGFSDQSHFTRVFKKVVGTSPSAYRKQAQKGKE